MELQIFNNEKFGSIRSGVTESGEAWFIAKDVCGVLDILKYRDAISTLEEFERGRPVIEDTPSGKQTMSTITEAGLYSLVMRSRKPEAQEFKKWIVTEVLPSIRKTGQYSIQPQQFVLPTTYKEALQSLLIEVEKNEQLSIENKEMKPKADFYDAVMGSNDLLDMNATAKILNIKNLGRNKLFEVLRDKEILMGNNLPYQRYIDADYFRVIETSINIGADVRIYKKTMLTQRGLEFLVKKLTDN